jgi:hypothetical protein
MQGANAGSDRAARATEVYRYIREGPRHVFPTQPSPHLLRRAPLVTWRRLMTGGGASGGGMPKCSGSVGSTPASTSCLPGLALCLGLRFRTRRRTPQQARCRDGMAGDAQNSVPSAPSERICWPTSSRSLSEPVAINHTWVAVLPHGGTQETDNRCLVVLL